jgi:hypothetical protein
MKKKYTAIKIIILVFLVRMLSSSGANHWDNFKRGLLGQPEIASESSK